VSATFVQFCVFVRSCCIVDLRFFRTGIFFDRAFYSIFVFFCHVAEFFLSHNRDQFFSQLCVIFKYFFRVFNIPVLLSECNHFCNRIYLQIKKILSPPQHHHLSSYRCFMFCVSALANLSTPLSRRGAFLYSGHISVSMFCAFLLRNYQ